MGLGYLKDRLFLVTSTHPIRFCRGRHAAGTISYRFKSGGSQETCLFWCSSPLWNLLPPEIRLAQSFLIFHKALEAGAPKGLEICPNGSIAEGAILLSCNIAPFVPFAQG